jgi:hypothetical protein
MKLNQDVSLQSPADFADFGRPARDTTTMRLGDKRFLRSPLPHRTIKRAALVTINENTSAAPGGDAASGGRQADVHL